MDALRQRGIQVDCIVGNSMGALVGSLYATAPNTSLKTRYRQFFRAYNKRTGGEAVNRSAAGAALGAGAALALGGPIGWLALLGGVLGASTTEEGSHKRFAHVLDDFYRHITIEQAPVPFVTFALQANARGLRRVTLSQGNLARAVLASTSNPFIFPDLDIRKTQWLDPGTDRFSAVPVQEACEAFPDSRLLVINVTDEPAEYAQDLACEVHEVRVPVQFDGPSDEEDEEDSSPEQEALTGTGEAFESAYQAGYDTVMAQAEL